MGTTASAPLMPMPGPTTATTATPVPTAATAAGATAATDTTDKRWIASRTSTSTAIPDEETQQYSVFKCDEQAATSQRKSRRALRQSSKLPFAAVMSAIKKIRS